MRPNNPFSALNANFSQDRLNQFFNMQNQTAAPAQQTQTAQAPQKKKNFWTDQISTLGGIIGGIGGSFVAPFAGTAAGGAAGSALGEAIENIITGDSIGKNLGKEAVLGGVFAGGPGKLAKGALGGTKALITGEKIVESASRAAMTPLRKKAGQSVLSAGDDLALKNFKINDSNWLNQFKEQIGEDAGQFARTRGFIGKAPEELRSTIQEPLQQIYKSSISKINPIPKTEIENGLKSIYQPLLKDIAPDNQALGQQIKAQADAVLGRLPRNINAAEAYDIKRTFDALVDQSLMDKSGKLANSVNKRTADVFRDAINRQADKSGVKFSGAIPIPGIKATNLKELGKELQGIDEFLDKADIKSQVGRGKNIAGLTPVIAAGSAISSGSPELAIPAAAGTMLLNSKAGTTGVSRLIGGAGNLLQKGASGGQTKKGIATRVVAGNQLFGGNAEAEEPQTLEDAIYSTSNNIDANMMPANSTNIPNASNMGSAYQNMPNMSSSYPQATSGNPYGRENLLADIQRDPRNADKYLAFYQELDQIFNPTSASNLDNLLMMQKLSGGGMKPLNATQQQQANNAVSALNDIGSIRSTLGSNPRVGLLNSIPGGSLSRRVTGTGDYEASRQNVADALGRLRSGGAINAEEERRFLNLLPATFDDSKTAEAKLQRLEELFNSFAYPQQTTGNLEDALMAYGGAY